MTMRTAAGCSLEIIDNNVVTLFIGQVLQTKQNKNVWAHRKALITFIGSTAEEPSKQGCTNFMTKALDGNSANDKKNCLSTFVAYRTQQTNKYVQTSPCCVFAEMGKLIQNDTSIRTDHANWALTSMIEVWYHSEKNNKQYYMHDDLIRNLIDAVLDRIRNDNTGTIIVGCFESLNASVSCVAPSQRQIEMSLLNGILTRQQNIVMVMQNKNSNENTSADTVRSFQLTECFSTVAAVVGSLANQHRQENPNKMHDPVPFWDKKQMKLVITAFTVANNNSENHSNNNNSNNNDGESRGVAQTDEELHAISVLAAACNNNFYQYLATNFVHDTLLATLNNDVEANANLCREAAAIISELFLRCEEFKSSIEVLKGHNDKIRCIK